MFDGLFRLGIVGSKYATERALCSCKLGSLEEIDLMIYNTSQSVQLGIRDLSTPVPPYKPHGSLSRDKFGALDNI